MLLFIFSFFNGLLAVLWLILLIYALLDVIRSAMPQNTKLLWIIIILIAPVLGSIIYLLWGRNQNNISI